MAMNLCNNVRTEMEIFQRRYVERRYGKRFPGISDERYEAAADEIAWAYAQIFGGDIEKDSRNNLTIKKWR